MLQLDVDVVDTLSLTQCDCSRVGYVLNVKKEINCLMLCFQEVQRSDAAEHQRAGGTTDV